MLVPTDVDREEGILLVFAGLFSLDIVALFLLKLALRTLVDELFWSMPESVWNF